VSPRGLIGGRPRHSDDYPPRGGFRGRRLRVWPRLIIDSVGDGKTQSRMRGGRVSHGTPGIPIPSGGRSAGSPREGGRLHGSQPASGPDASRSNAAPAVTEVEIGSRRSGPPSGSPAVPALLDQHGSFEGNPTDVFPMRSVRRGALDVLSRAVHRLVPLPSRSSGRRVLEEIASKRASTLTRGTRRRLPRKSLGLIHGLGDAHRTRTRCFCASDCGMVRRKVPCQAHHHGSLLCGPESEPVKLVEISGIGRNPANADTRPRDEEEIECPK